MKIGTLEEIYKYFFSFIGKCDYEDIKGYPQLCIVMNLEAFIYDFKRRFN
jgi:hypothetical protein